MVATLLTDDGSDELMTEDGSDFLIADYVMDGSVGIPLVRSNNVLSIVKRDVSGNANVPMMLLSGILRTQIHFAADAEISLISSANNYYVRNIHFAANPELLMLTSAATFVPKVIFDNAAAIDLLTAAAMFSVSNVKYSSAATWPLLQCVGLFSKFSRHVIIEDFDEPSRFVRIRRPNVENTCTPTIKPLVQKTVSGRVLTFVSTPVQYEIILTFNVMASDTSTIPGLKDVLQNAEYVRFTFAGETYKLTWRDTELVITDLSRGLRGLSLHFKGVKI